MRTTWGSIAIFCGFAASSLGASCNPDASSVPTSGTICGAGQRCSAGRCTVDVPADALPPEGFVTIAENPAPSELSSDVIAPFVCALDFPTAPPSRPVRLTANADHGGGAPLAPRAMLFRYQAPVATGLQSSVTTGATVDALVTTGGSYGITQRPDPASLELAMTDDPLSSDTTAALLRNVSLQPIAGAYFDGTHLFVGDGPRVLVYDGVPASPAVRPKLVVGQPALDTIASGVSAAEMGGTVEAVWSNGSKLIVATGNRVLIWSTLPTTDFAVADLVLGQQDFVGHGANVGGVSAATMSFPNGIDSDGTRLLVADTLNHRVLAWNEFPTRIGQPATSVLGQPSFSVGDPGFLEQAFGAKLDGQGAFVAANFGGSFHFADLGMNAAPDFVPIPAPYSNVTRDGLGNPTSITTLPGGGLAMSDWLVARIGVHRTTPTGPRPMDFVLGQPAPDRMVENPVSGSTVTISAKVIAAGGLVMVADKARLLVYDHVPTFNYEPATRVIGQAGFTTNDFGADYRRISARTLAYPADVAAHGGTVAVADRGNNRVLLFPAGSLPDADAAATVVLGQPDAASFIPNVDQLSPSASTLSGPAGVALDDTHLVVADTANHRVLIWTPVPTASGTPATFVLGQSSFDGRRPNHGRGDGDGDGYSDAAADGMFEPTGVATDGTHLVVADRLNHRLLVWMDLGSIASDKPADRVIGQPSFASVIPNRGAGYDAPQPDGLNLPTGITLSGTSLWVADTENNRVVRYDDVFGAAVPAAFIGQTSGTALDDPNAQDRAGVHPGLYVIQPTRAGSVLRPRGVAVTSDRLYVSEIDSHRVHVFDRTSPVPAALGQIGQPDATGNVLNANGISARSLAVPAGVAALGGRLFVADSANHRVLGYEIATAPVAPSPAATVVIGQSSSVANGFNQSAAVTAGGVSRPRGLALSNDELFVVESDRHRVLVQDLPLVAGRTPKQVLGQPDVSLSLPNAGGGPSASSLSSPRGVFADGARIVVADTGNHRVLVYPRDPTTGGAASTAAALVLGQASFGENAPNRAGAASMATLDAPEAAFVEGSRLVVADTGNHRVLVWNTFPGSNGQAADIVLGQPDATGHLPNGGTGIATASTMAVPSGVHVAEGKLFVADAGNDRVLIFDPIPSTSGAAASQVLGQTAFGDRIPASDINDRTRLAGPVALASDGASLFVADRDESRVLAFDLAALTSGVAATAVFNANSGLLSSAPGGLAVERTPLFTSRLYVANPDADRVIVLGSVSRIR